MTNKIATIILNRNLPEPTNKLVEHLHEFDGINNDIFVLEAGSDQNLVSNSLGRGWRRRIFVVVKYSRTRKLDRIA